MTLETPSLIEIDSNLHVLLRNLTLIRVACEDIDSVASLTADLKTSLPCFLVPFIQFSTAVTIAEILHTLLLLYISCCAKFLLNLWSLATELVLYN